MYDSIKDKLKSIIGLDSELYEISEKMDDLVSENIKDFQEYAFNILSIFKYIRSLSDKYINNRVFINDIKTLGKNLNLIFNINSNVVAIEYNGFKYELYPKFGMSADNKKAFINDIMSSTDDIQFQVVKKTEEILNDIEKYLITEKSDEKDSFNKLSKKPFNAFNDSLKDFLDENIPQSKEIDEDNWLDFDDSLPELPKKPLNLYKNKLKSAIDEDDFSDFL